MDGENESFREHSLVVEASQRFLTRPWNGVLVQRLLQIIRQLLRYPLWKDDTRLSFHPSFFPPFLIQLYRIFCALVLYYFHDKLLLTEETVALLIRQLQVIKEREKRDESISYERIWAATKNPELYVLYLCWDALEETQQSILAIPDLKNQNLKIGLSLSSKSNFTLISDFITLCLDLKLLHRKQLELDITYINSVETITDMRADKEVGVGRETNTQIIDEQIQSQVVAPPGEQAVIFKPDEKLPAGVSKLQGDFLREVQQSGVLQRFQEKNEKTKVNEKPTETAKMIYRYYGTEATYEDIAKDYPITYGAVKDRIRRGIKKMRWMLYETDPEFAQKDPYPLVQIQKGKPKVEVFKTDKSKKRRSEASRTAAKSQESIKKRSEAGKKGGGQPKYKTEEERRGARLESYQRYNREKRPSKQGKQQGDAFNAPGK